MTSQALRLLAAAGLSAGLAACAAPRVPDAVAGARLPSEQFAARVVTSPAEVRLAVHADGLSANQADALAAFASDWREAEGGPIRIQTPGGAGADPAAAYRAAAGVRNRLVAAGVPDGMIAVASYDAAGKADAPIVVGYVRYQVDLPRCGQRWTDLSRTGSNEAQPNFGCAVTANIAAQIADPADLAGPRAMGPADAGRREVVLEHYRKGEITSSARDENANGAVSKAVK
ncbi:CpaD family pilus assembly protein [Phenylobacterium sp.]|uniref:CpaD family pilus assembly protein n=1 Tax=Phenylobacterium sp. TaxID=1871053 RepID=UPI0035B4A74E